MIDGLYLITNDDLDGDLLPRISAALKGGARVIQYREKLLPVAERVGEAKKILTLCRKHGATFIINDLPELAWACGADGVHLGQGDTSIAEARKILGPNKLIGVSTHNPEEAMKAAAQGADYVAIGSMYPTGTKDDAVVVGIDMLRKVKRAVDIPVVAIGGITARRADELLEAGADSVAVISAVMSDPNPALAAGEFALLFNRRVEDPRGQVMTIAGSDSGGGAGLQADIKTITLLGSYASSAVTALTAQNTTGVKAVEAATPHFVGAQIKAVLDDIGADVIKTGMLYSAEIVEIVANAIEHYALMAVVYTVMIAKGGAPLLRQDAVAAMRDKLLPNTYLLTPNLPEAEALSGLSVKNEAGMEKAARKLHAMGARNVLLKGGHLEGEPVDLLLTDEELLRLPSPRFDTPNTHGTGCTYSAAIATFLAQGHPLVRAVALAKQFMIEALRTAVTLGGGHGPVNHFKAAATMQKQTGPS